MPHKSYSQLFQNLSFLDADISESIFKLTPEDKEKATWKKLS